MTWYWDAASGKRLAVEQGSDVQEFCGLSSYGITFGDVSVPPSCNVIRDATTLICSNLIGNLN